MTTTKKKPFSNPRLLRFTNTLTREAESSSISSGSSSVPIGINLSTICPTNFKCLILFCLLKEKQMRVKSENQSIQTYINKLTKQQPTSRKTKQEHECYPLNQYYHQ